LIINAAKKHCWHFMFLTLSCTHLIFIDRLLDCTVVTMRTVLVSDYIIHCLNVYSARKAITLIVEVANAGSAHMILVVLTVSL
jgi:hypothetical protein